jgi:NTE family protein
MMWMVRPPVLALGGGGARGFAHLGVLSAMDELGLPAPRIVGTSMGAVVGAMVIAYGSADCAMRRWREAIDQGLVVGGDTRRSPDHGQHEHPLVQTAKRIRNRVVVSFAMNRQSMLSHKAVDRALIHLVPAGEVQDLPRRFVAVAVDLATGEEVRLDRGDLRTVLRASAAIPGILPGVELDGRLLVDGGVVAEVPVAAAAAEGRPVLAVDVSMELPPLAAERLVLDVMMRTQSMTAARLRRRQLRGLRWVIHPDVGSVTWSEWDRFDDLVAAGRRAFLQWFLGDTRAARWRQGRSLP